MVEVKNISSVIQQYLADFKSYAADQEFSAEPNTLYQPLDYALSNSGKALRPVLVLMACEMFQDSYKEALPAALAIEWFHNFTLIHDDIMDDADIRRGKPSVYAKYGTNTAILSGDALLIKAYQQLANSPQSALADVLHMFNKTALGVCEGQQYDVDFETADSVHESEYLRMIGLKTAVLLSASVYIGARIGGASQKQAEALYKGTYDIGVAFQIQDDILDSFGNEKTFGKRIGGDILNNKKTILCIHAMQQANPGQMHVLHNLMNKAYSGDEQDKIDQITEIFIATQAKSYAEEVRDSLFHSGKAIIEKNCENKAVFNRFYAFTQWLMHRNV